MAPIVLRGELFLRVPECHFIVVPQSLWWFFCAWSAYVVFNHPRGNVEHRSHSVFFWNYHVSLLKEHTLFFFYATFGACVFFLFICHFVKTMLIPMIALLDEPAGRRRLLLDFFLGWQVNITFVRCARRALWQLTVNVFFLFLDASVTACDQRYLRFWRPDGKQPREGKSGYIRS